MMTIDELSMTNRSWNSERAQRGGSVKDLFHLVFHLEAALALPSALRVSYRTITSYKPSSKKAPRHEQSISLQEMHEECLHAFSVSQREWECSSSSLRCARETPVCPLQKTREGKDQASQYIKSPCSNDHNA